MAEGYSVDPEALKMAADGINNSINELKSLGIDESAEVGRGFSNVDLTGMELGNSDLHSSFAKFSERWAWGVRTLVQDGNELARRLGLSAGIYHDQEQYVVGVTKDVANAAAGNPDLTTDQVEKQSLSKSVGNAWTPDYSAQSAAKAADDMKKTWQAEGRDMMGSRVGPPGLVRAAHEAVGSGSEYDQLETDMFGTRVIPPQQRTGRQG